MGINMGLYEGWYIVGGCPGFIAKDDLPPNTKEQSPRFETEDDAKKRVDSRVFKRAIDDF